MLIICPIAGVGTRLFPITKNKPKAMLKVAGKRIIDHLMDKIGKIASKDTQICFIVGFYKEQLIKYLGDYYTTYYNLIFVEQQPLGLKEDFPFYSGLGDAIALAAEYGRDEDCFIILSDRYPLEDYTSMIETTNINQLDGCFNAQKVENPQYYGVISPTSDGLISNIIEKPKEFISDIAVSGAYYFRKTISAEMFDVLEEQAKQPITSFKEHQFTSGVQKLLSKGYKLGYNLMKRPVLDFGRPSELLHANKTLINEFYKTKRNEMKSKICIGKGTKLIKSDIGEYTSIGINTIIEDCSLENSIIGDNCKLKNLSLKNAIVDDNSTNSNYQGRYIQL